MSARALPRKRAASITARPIRTAIYGEATDAELRELADEGIKFGRIPWIPRTDG